MELTRKQKKTLNDCMPRVFKLAKSVAAERQIPITEVLGYVCFEVLSEPEATVILLKDAPEMFDNPDLQQALVDRIRATGEPHMPVLVRVIDGDGDRKTVAFYDPSKGKAV